MNTYILWFLVTAYCPCTKCCGQDACGLVASGIEAKGKIISAPKTYSFGTRMYIKNYGWATVQDRGKAIQGNRLEVLFPSHQQAKEWANKKGKIWLPVMIEQPSVWK